MTPTLNLSPNADQNTHYQLVVIAFVGITIALIAVCTRMFVRARIVRAVGWDDWIILFAVVSRLPFSSRLEKVANNIQTIGSTATVSETIAFHNGLGRHEYDFTPSQRELFRKYSHLSQAFCIMSLCFAKISICISLLRVISHTNAKGWRCLIYALALLQSISNSILIIALFVECRPARKVWDTGLSGSCWPSRVGQDLGYQQGGN